MKSIISAILISSVILLNGCTPKTGFTKSDDGKFEYKTVTTNDGPKVKVGDLVALHNNLMNGDSVIFSTYGRSAQKINISQEQLDNSIIIKPITLMAEGDSMVVQIPFDSLRAQLQAYAAAFKSGDMATITYKLEDIISPEEQKLNAAKEMGFDDVATWEAAKADAISRGPQVDATMKEKIDAFKAGKLADVQTTDSGLKYVILELGQGANAQQGQTVYVHYSGMLEADGTKFDGSMSAERGDPLKIAPLGAGRVIPGWDEGIALLNKGAKAILFIPSNLAYGENGAGAQIPPNSNLAFYVEIANIK